MTGDVVHIFPEEDSGNVKEQACQKERAKIKRLVQDGLQSLRRKCDDELGVLIEPSGRVLFDNEEKKARARQRKDERGRVV
ncbi:MAG: hypothetical protein UR28_C0019G0017 [Candidatus Peregrinibacteria bacterium GW2011_GWF2_33_10]|nr:MAG: hypothetical protein UR28_C0019G0017 [Candidatus Peregrinibacteria bacterium GW2011_GWF2_33_10]OGJ43980.1 MAG: hypothetical protein A2272_05100 [Candidatus Peregrinibacteria bacterium RIFOXYA12_FULL_33_12]OGJ45522.1 MAG: hypothetical protein A2263_05985 [Candidatus Peregrinibacteria bacterium RIFOXYA2_FULL_33_21]OGJ50003.1 MAG: hypothetical protein A2307_04515 [Candidatus Peregrinibacteria bacterium RIFOXYB2_FULL_33_20]